MTKRALLTSIFVLILVLGATTSSMAAWYAAAAPSGDYASGAVWSSGLINVPNPDSTIPGSTSPWLRANFNWAANGGVWSGTDTLTLTIFRNGTAIDTVVINPLRPTGSGPAALGYQKEWFAYSGGVYELQAVSSTNGGNELWHMTSASFSSTSTNPTPIPAAVWMLGSGLLGIAGFKRSRRNSAS